ncbi:choline/glycine/proline betaine transport protein [Salibacterium salarium]|uniref:choline BCCT transporter BetT n=1 Tax=Salibacterium salarium TaxID=284579 RepID=UPI00278115D9|nr:choline BCCT transporter BetT [Salibacterium salarium]MDQ0300502.1 choline/glycine/proline betaine transport protein [Salibacterium salarium]
MTIIEGKENNSNTFNHTKKQKTIKPLVFYGSATIIILLAFWTIFYPKASENLIGVVEGGIVDNLGWYYILTTTFVLIFVISIAFGKTGNIKMGSDDSTPRYNMFSWAAMLFAAGIGTDILFYSASAPVSHYLFPPAGQGETSEAARQAVIWALFHYGITGWALYMLMGLALGLFAFRYELPLSIRSMLYPIFGKRVKGVTGDTIEIAAVLGTIFGIAASLGIGVLQLNYGLNIIFDIPIGLSAQIGLIVVAILIACASTFSGVDAGIRRLSQLNVFIAIGLVLYVLIAGQTQFLLNALVQNIGDYVSKFPSMTLATFAYGEASEWLSQWTLFFWAWWVAWAPFVGLFLARISRGRTIRQFVMGTIIIPFIFTLLLFSVFGNSALSVVMDGNSSFGNTAANNPESGFYMLLEQFPGATITIAVATFLGLMFFVTSADSASLVMSNFTSNVASTYGDGPPWLRIFWAVAIGFLTLSLLALGGLTALQYATIIIGLPFSVVLYLIMFSLHRVLKHDRL